VALEYMVSLDCQVKERHGDDLVRMIKSRAALEMMIDSMRASGDKRSLDEIEIVRVIQRPEGATEVRVTATELRGDTAALDVERAHCKGCRADRGSGGFGCYGAINYPVPETSERWLLDGLPADHESPEMELLQRAIRDFDYSGAPSRRMRDTGDTFFEARTAPRRTWGKRLLGGPKLAITSDQLFHMMWHVGAIQPTHARMLCVFLGMVPFEALRGTTQLKIDMRPPEDERTLQLARFLTTLAFAASNELAVAIDA
jgi:hypothetical protein